jgi:hypothetical protein
MLALLSFDHWHLKVVTDKPVIAGGGWKSSCVPPSTGRTDFRTGGEVT